MKYFKEGDYYVNLVHPSLRSVIGDEDFTDMVSDFSKFSYLGVDVMGDTIRLINTPDKGFIFVRYPSADGKFIRANEILKIRRKKKMNEQRINTRGENRAVRKGEGYFRTSDQKSGKIR